MATSCGFESHRPHQAKSDASCITGTRGKNSPRCRVRNMSAPGLGCRRQRPAAVADEPTQPAGWGVARTKVTAVLGAPPGAIREFGVGAKRPPLDLDVNPCPESAIFWPRRRGIALANHRPGAGAQTTARGATHAW